MNSQKLILISFLLSSLSIGSFIGYSIYRKKEPINSRELVNQEKEKEKAKKRIRRKKTEERGNNNTIYPTFFLNNKKTIISLQCLIDTIILIVVFYYVFKFRPTDDKYLQQYHQFCRHNGQHPKRFEYPLWFIAKEIKFGLSWFVILGLVYLITHVIVIFPLTLIFKFTSKNSYWYLWKNY